MSHSYENYATELVEKFSHKQIPSLTRFPTGLANYVYDVELADGERLVVRIGSKDNFHGYDAAIYWYEKLKPLGVPLPEFYEYSNDPDKSEYPYIIMERLEGKDLGEVYSTLTIEQKASIAKRIIELQDIVSKLPPGNGFGFAGSYEADNLQKTWLDLLMWHIERSRSWLNQANVVPEKIIDDVKAVLVENEPLFKDIPSTPFLDDITTKNVLVHDGRFSGIVDVDWIGFGDPLFTPALTKVSLLFSGKDTDYVDYWVELLKLDDQAEKRFNLYCALFCANLLAETGLRFNKDTAEKIDQSEIARFKEILYSFINNA